MNKPEEIKWAENHLKTLDENLEKHVWDGEWYLSAYRDDRLKLVRKKMMRLRYF